MPIESGRRQSGPAVPGDTTPEFDAALAAMTPGETSAEPVASRFGQHIIRLDRKIEGRQLPFEQVRDRIADYLADRDAASPRSLSSWRASRRAPKCAAVDLPTPADLRVS